MTKISPVQNNTIPNYESGLKKSSEKGFQGHLQKALQHKESSPITGHQTQSLGEVQSSPLTSLHPSTHQIIRETERLIDLIDTYRQQMADPQKSLKDIEPVLQALNKQKGRLQNFCQQTSMHDAPLADIVNACTLTVDKEMVQFYRGDYI